MVKWKLVGLKQDGLLVLHHIESGASYSQLVEIDGQKYPVVKEGEC